MDHSVVYDPFTGMGAMRETARGKVTIIGADMEPVGQIRDMTVKGWTDVQGGTAALSANPDGVIYRHVDFETLKVNGELNIPHVTGVFNMRPVDMAVTTALTKKLVGKSVMMKMDKRVPDRVVGTFEGVANPYDRMVNYAVSGDNARGIFGCNVGNNCEIRTYSMNDGMPESSRSLRNMKIMGEHVKNIVTDSKGETILFTTSATGVYLANVTPKFIGDGRLTLDEVYADEVLSMGYVEINASRYAVVITAENMYGYEFWANASPKDYASRSDARGLAMKPTIVQNVDVADADDAVVFSEPLGDIHDDGVVIIVSMGPGGDAHYDNINIKNFLKSTSKST